MEAKERTARLPQWLERMTLVGSADQPARVIFDRPDVTVADMSVDEYIAWRALHPDESPVKNVSQAC